jgi:hypothetical protein
MWVSANDHATSHSSEQGTLPTTSLISKQAVPYRTHGGTCCPGVSTPKIWSLADSSMTNHKPWRSQPSAAFQTLLKPHYRTSPLSPHLTTDGRPTHSTQAKLNIIKMERLVWWLKTVGLSNTTNHKNSILKYEGLGNQLMHVVVYTRERKHIRTKWSRGTSLASHLLLLRVFSSYSWIFLDNETS